MGTWTLIIKEVDIRVSLGLKISGGWAGPCCVYLIWGIRWSRAREEMAETRAPGGEDEKREEREGWLAG